ncbi:unnamed protein product [Meloidogyne enterolobii]|uniref:Uncharacterized protein n=1 Tax=Meloidogyne enterolobii TaxID=390850 RepID=A0ACB1B4X1_MELEN
MSDYFERFISTDKFKEFNEEIAEDVMRIILSEVSSFTYRKTCKMTRSNTMASCLIQSS